VSWPGTEWQGINNGKEYKQKGGEKKITQLNTLHINQNQNKILV